LICAIEEQLAKLKLRIKVYGSFATGLWTNSSDINLVAIPCLEETVMVDELMKKIQQELAELRDYVDEVEYSRDMRMIRINANVRDHRKRVSLTILDSTYKGD
jgi:predicted nucleotidyltransferase